MKLDWLRELGRTIVTCPTFFVIIIFKMSWDGYLVPDPQRVARQCSADEVKRAMACRARLLEIRYGTWVCNLADPGCARILLFNGQQGILGRVDGGLVELAEVCSANAVPAAQPAHGSIMQ